MTDSEIRQRILYVCKVDGADSDFNVVAFHALCDALIAAEREALERENDALRQVCRDIYEVWGGSDALPVPETAPEAYLLRLVQQMRDAAREGLK